MDDGFDLSPTRDATPGDAAASKAEGHEGAGDSRLDSAIESQRAEQRLGAARHFANAGHGDEAAVEIKQLLSSPWTPPEVLAQAGDLAVSIGCADLSAACFRRAIVEAGSDAPAQWSALAANQLDQLGAAAPGLAAVMANRLETEGVCRDAIAGAPRKAASEALLHYRLARVLLQRDDDVALRELAQMVVRGDGPLESFETVEIAPLLDGHVPHLELTAWLQRALERDPHHPDLIRTASRRALAGKMDLELIWPRLHELYRLSPQNAANSELAGLGAFAKGEWDLAVDALSTAADQQHSAELWWRAGNAALYLGHDDAAEAFFRRMSPRLAPSALGPLAEPLHFLLKAVNSSHFREEKTDLTALAAGLEASLSQLEKQFREETPWSPAQLFGAVEQLDSARRIPFRLMAEIPERHAFVKRFDHRYTSLDLPAFSLVNQSLLNHEAALLAAAADALLRDRPPGGLDFLIYFPALLTDVFLERDEPDAVRRWLREMSVQGMAGGRVNRALERCDLHNGITVAVAQRWPLAEKASAHLTAYADSWKRIESPAIVRHWREPGVDGIVERRRCDGRLEEFRHQTTEFEMEVLGTTNLEVRRGEIIIGAQGALLRPPNWHVRAGDYPQEYGLAVNAARGAAVLASDLLEEIEEPVLVLAGSDPLSRPNYYHWMNFQITRVAWAKREGWLQERRLLIPEGLTPWMLESLQLAGAPEERRLVCSAERRLRLRDAWLVSSFDHPGANLYRAAREQIWCGAGVDPDASPRRSIFLGRPNDARRPVFDQAALLNVICEAGFDYIDTGALSVAEQVRLLSDARAVAGFGGAAMANLMFVREAVRILDLTCEATQWPEFTGIALSLGQHYRYLSGQVPDSCRVTRPLDWVPTRYDLGVLQRELDWANRAGS